MKKQLASAFLCIFALFCATSQKALQLFMPKTVYVGDTAELRYIFHSETDIFAAATAALAEPTATQSSEQSADSPIRILTLALPEHALTADESCAIKYAALEHMENEYTFTCTIVPWKAGTLSFLALDMTQLVYQTLSASASQAAIAFASPVVIQLAPVTIHSRAAEQHITELRPPSPPLVVPGTTAILIVLAIAAIACSAVLIALLMKLPALSMLLLSTHAARKQALLALKKLRRLQRNWHKHSLEKRAFCAELQHILRTFLEKRFSRPFMPLTTPALYATFEELAGGTIEKTHQESIQALIELFARTDYIRFAQEAEGWTQTSADELIEKACTCILAFDVTAQASNSTAAPTEAAATGALA